MLTLTTNGITLLNNPELLSPELCDELRNYIDQLDSDGKLTPGDASQDGYNVRCSQHDLVSKEKYHAVIKDLFQKLRDPIRRHFKIEVGGDSGYQLRKIHGTTSLHTDGSTDGIYVRNLSCVVALNSDFGGGEVSFPQQDFLYQMSKGDILLFPPYWTHPHQVFPPHVGTMRYTINSWFYEKEVSLPNFFFPSGDPTINRYD